MQSQTEIASPAGLDERGSPAPQLYAESLPRRLRQRFQDLTLAAAEQYGFSISPYTLAEFYAGGSDFGTAPESFLVAMLRRWPLPAYEPIPPTMEGAFALGQYSLAAAELELPAGLDPRELALSIDTSVEPNPRDGYGLHDSLYGRFRRFRSAEIIARASRVMVYVLGQQFGGTPNVTEDTPLQEYRSDRIELLAALEDEFGIELKDEALPAGGTLGDAAAIIGSAVGHPAAPNLSGSMRPIPERWPDWLPWFSFLPLLLAILWAGVSLMRASRAALVNPPERMLGSAAELASRELERTAPRAARRLARQLSWSEPEPCGRLDIPRSITETLRRGGFSTPVYMKRSRAAEFVFLLPRQRAVDHEYHRVRRLIDALERGGLTLHVYEYSPDPRSLQGRSARSSQAGTLDLRALRELHSEARLVLLGDGSDLVDYLTDKPLPFVAEQLRRWPARMLLTPVPVAEWSEREMNLSAALGGPIGRVTAEGLEDLAVAFGERRRADLWRPPAMGADGSLDDLVERVHAWLNSIQVRLGATGAVPPRTIELRLDESILISDVAPPRDYRRALVKALREWLGEDGFYWLAACTAYPQLRFVVTLYLGNHLYGERGPLYDERRLAQLALLPWFRRGRMPIWLRELLFSELPPAHREAVRQAVAGMLVASPGRFTALGGPAWLDREALTIWLPDEDGDELAPDDVIADLMMREVSDITPVLRLPLIGKLFRQHVWSAVADRLAMLAAVAAWCAAIFWIWPSSTAAPHPPGVWLPVLAATAAAAIGLFILALIHRLRWIGWFERESAKDVAADDSRLEGTA